MEKRKSAPRRSAQKYLPEQVVLLGRADVDTQVEVEIGRTSTKGWRLLAPMLRVIRVNGPLLRGEIKATNLPAVEVYVPTIMATHDLGRGDAMSSTRSKFKLEGTYSNVKIHGESTLAQMLLSEMPEGTMPDCSYTEGGVVCLVTVAPISVTKGSAKHVRRGGFWPRMKQVKKRLTSKRLSHASGGTARDLTQEVLDTVNRQLDALGVPKVSKPDVRRAVAVTTKPLRIKAGKP